MVCNNNINTLFIGFIVTNVLMDSAYSSYSNVTGYVIDSYVVDLLSIGVSGLLLFIFLVLAFTFGGE